MKMQQQQRFSLVGLARLGVIGLSAACLLAACGDKQNAAANKAVAKVNKAEVTLAQVNLLLQQQRGLRPEQVDVVGKQILERLIDQELALQKASELKLDRDPRVVQMIEAARREIIARAYIEKLGEGAAKPGADEIKKYYEDKPVLFKDRRIYSIQDINIEAKPEQVPALRQKLADAQNIGEFIEFLKANDFKFTGNQAVRAAEQLPMQNLDALARMHDGQAVLGEGPNGVQVVVLAGSRSQPVSEDQARPAIEQFLLNERKRKLIEDDVKQMRAAAKIEYVGKFGGGAPAGAAAAASTATSGATP